MNIVILKGRLTKDPEIKTTNDLTIAKYTLAVDRIKKGEADFIPCVCFGKTAEFAQKYLHKGTMIAIEGEIRTGSYERKGEKVYTTEIAVKSHEFCGEKTQTVNSKVDTPKINFDGFLNDISGDEELPFE